MFGKEKDGMVGVESSSKIGSSSSQVVNRVDRDVEMTPPAPPLSMAMSTTAFSFMSTPTFNAKMFGEAAAMIT